ncbi:MAG: DUF1638 domain-containing protein [Boseongicola sp. SB0676_bin_33]|uniref:DUF1638 domain-containing protein n=1 Tax=Boseongicola sp. SB0664_bin_43 TaxID=2604844 RepID=A0A6B0Y037_9RHOB|nr:DUF1638 domain-containing protein [Boseongicola sp. SB0664_bin_43]MYF90056.1 DUF1638 domain-containing protein [Boseongicola sp. SB0676_bin_33]
MDNPSDSELTEQGLSPEGRGRILVLGCGALAREILALTRDFDHIDLHCLPAIYHNHPERIVPAVRNAVAKATAYDRVFLAYADCGTGGELAKAAEELGIEMMGGPHCFAFYQGTEDFLHRSDHEFTSFYLTDFLVRQFDAFVWKPLGLDRHPELRDSYFGHYSTLVYQAQTDNPALVEKARDCARRLGLEFEHRVTGYGDLETALSALAEKA